MIPLLIGTLIIGIITTYKTFDPIFKRTIAQLNRYDN